MREMTGTEILSRRASDLLCHYDNPKLAKSRSSLELTSNGRADHHRVERAHDRRGHAGQRPNDKVTNGSMTYSRKNSRLAQRGSGGHPKASNSKSKPKEAPASQGHNENHATVDGGATKTGTVTPILPPISCHQITATMANLKSNGGLSPRPLDVSGPTRMAVRNSASPENLMVGGGAKPHDHHHNNHQHHHRSNSSLDGGVPPSPTITAGAHSNNPPPVRTGSSAAANNVISFGRAGNMASPDSPRGQGQESSRLSPINNHDRPKVKFEKKVLKLLVDESGPSSPRAHKLSSADTGKQQLQAAPPSREGGGGGGGGAKPRRQSVKSLPKIAPPEEPFSVRRKIEQFRKWHEEHYADALKSSPGEQEDAETKSARRSRNGGGVEKSPMDGVDFAKVLEENIEQNHRVSAAGGEEQTTDMNGGGGGGGENARQDINGNDIVDKPKNSSSSTSNNNNHNNNNNNNREARGGGGSKSRQHPRPKSGATWKTWRDVNQSDAYNDVKKYIKDNELMDDEREKWIRTWICDVRTAMEEPDDMFVDE